MNLRTYGNVQKVAERLPFSFPLQQYDNMKRLLRGVCDTQ